jgi:hypothetical protein
MIFGRMRDAIASLHLNPSDQLATASDPWSSNRPKETILQGTQLRDVLLRAFSPTPGEHHEPRALQDPDDASYPPAGHATLSPDAEAPVDENAPDHAPHEPVIASKSASTSSATAMPRKLEGAFMNDQLIQSWARRYARSNPVRIEGDPVLPLNEAQTRAVAMMIGERASLVQGVRHHDDI